jgi:hypothetical protein
LRHNTVNLVSASILNDFKVKDNGDLDFRDWSNNLITESYRQKYHIINGIECQFKKYHPLLTYEETEEWDNFALELDSSDEHWQSLNW